MSPTIEEGRTISNEDAARSWTAAKARLEDLRIQHATVSRDLEEARKLESATWTVLERLAGREPPPAVAIPVPESLR